MLLVRLANENRRRAAVVLVDGRPAAGSRTARPRLTAVEAYQAALPPIGPTARRSVELLRAPAARPPDVARRPAPLRQGALGRACWAMPWTRCWIRMLLTLDVMAEEERGLHLRFGGGGFGDGRRPRRGGRAWRASMPSPSGSPATPLDAAASC